MFKPHQLIQTGAADVPIQSADGGVSDSRSEDVRTPEVKFARVWQPDDLFEGKPAGGGFVSQPAASLAAKRFALQDLDSIFLIGPRTAESAVQGAALPAPADDAPAEPDGPSAAGVALDAAPAPAPAGHSQQEIDDARAQGYAAGMDEARTQLYDQIRAEIESEKVADSQAQTGIDQALVEALQAALAAMQQDPQQFFAPVKRLALHIAEQLVLGELRLDGSAIERLVQRCVDDLAANDASMVQLELHPGDLHALHDLRKRAGLVEKNLPQLLANEDLPPGSVRASANDALVEDLITNRLAAIARVLNMDTERVRTHSAFHPERLEAERLASTAVQDVPVRMGSAAPARSSPADVLDVEDSDV